MKNDSDFDPGVLLGVVVVGFALALSMYIIWLLTGANP